jgi:hypothetical protein
MPQPHTIGGMLMTAHMGVPGKSGMYMSVVCAAAGAWVVHFPPVWSLQSTADKHTEAWPDSWLAHPGAAFDLGAWATAVQQEGGQSTAAVPGSSQVQHVATAALQSRFLGHHDGVLRRSHVFVGATLSRLM